MLAGRSCCCILLNIILRVGKELNHKSFCGIQGKEIITNNIEDFVQIANRIRFRITLSLETFVFKTRVFMITANTTHNSRSAMEIDIGRSWRSNSPVKEFIFVFRAFPSSNL